VRVRKLQIILIVWLLCLNLVLGLYSAVEKRQADEISTSQLDRILDLYRDNGITFQKKPSRRIVSWRALQLGPADLDGLVRDFLGDLPYEQTFIYESRAQYVSDDRTITVDWSQHSISYQDLSIAPSGSARVSGSSIPQGSLTPQETMMLEEIGRRFAARWLGENVFLQSSVPRGNYLDMTFCQMDEGRIYYFNRIRLSVSQKGIGTASMVIWDVTGRGEKLDTMPADEMLYAQLSDILAEGQEDGTKITDTVTGIYDGYEIEEQTDQKATAVPDQTLVLSSGKTVRLSYLGK
jgi:hypothetical protein